MTCDRTQTWHRLAAAGALVCVVTLGGCADFSRGATVPGLADGGGGAGGSAGDDAAAATSFTGVYPLLVPNCQKCHSAGQSAGDTKLLFTGAPAADYAAVVTFVDTSSPSASRLLAKMRGSGHQGGTVYAIGSPEYLTVLRWIEQGAREQ